MTNEPTISDLLHELKILSLEIRAGFAESKARDAELASKQQTFWDALADFRREYNEHTHPDAA